MKIPKGAKKVFKGIIFDVYQWKQKQFDGMYKTFEMVKRQSTVLVVATVKAKIVIIHQRQPGHKAFLGLPGGRMDKDKETPRQCAIRELLEETGLKPKQLNLWMTKDHAGHIQHRIYVYIAKDCEQVSIAMPDSGEKIKTHFYSFTEFINLSENPRFAEGVVKTDLYKAKIDKNFRAKLKKIIFN